MSVIENFRASSPARQILAAAVVVLLLCAVLTAGYFIFLRKPYAVLFTNLRTMDAATIVAELDKKKIPYRLADGGATIRVPQEVVDATRLDVMSGDLPLKGTVGFELFNKSDMGLTEFAQRINYQRALQGELERTIMSLDTVDAARVHLSITEPTIFRDDRRPPKASVTVTPRPGRTLAADTVRGVQRLVAAAVPDLSPSDVVVLDEHGAVVSSDVAPDSASTSAAAGARRAVEQYYVARIKLAVEKIFPGGDVQATVTARPSPGAPSVEETQTALEGWSPGARTFGLSVQLDFPHPPSEQMQEDVKTAAGEAIGLDPALGDSVSLSISALAPPAPVNTAAAQPAPWQAQAPRRLASFGLSPEGFWLAALAPLLALLVGTAVFLHRRGRPKRLSARERNRYVDRFEAVFDKGDANVAPGA